MAFPTSYSSPYAVSPGGTALAADVNQYQPLAQNLETTVGVSSGTASPTGTHEQRLKYLEQGAGTVGGTPALTFGTANSPGTAYTRVRTDATLAVFSTPAYTLGTASAMGTATTWARADATLALFSATVPGTASYGDAASAGTAAFAARQDHQHGMPSFARTFMLIGV